MSHTADLMRRIREVRSKFPLDSVHRVLEGLEQLKVLVVGDIIVDEYVYCQVMGTTSKYPCLSARESSRNRMLGGAAAVARHVSQLSNSVTFVTCTGGRNPEYLDFVKEGVGKEVRQSLFFVDPLEPTVVKCRYITGGYPHALNPRHTPSASNLGTRVFEISSLPERPFEDGVTNQYVEHLIAEVGKHDVVILCDFGHGAITRGVYEAAVKGAKYCAVNIQTNSSNFGFNTFRKLQGYQVDYLCIDEVEARLPFSDRESSLDTIFKKIHGNVARSLMITRGRLGLSLSQDENILEFPALATETIDTVGAGDSVLATSTLLDHVRCDRNLTAFLSVCTGHLATKIVGNERSVSRSELLGLVQELYSSPYAS